MAGLQRAEQQQAEGGREGERENGLALEPYNKLKQEVIQRQTHTQNKTTTHARTHMSTRVYTSRNTEEKKKTVNLERIPPPPPYMSQCVCVCVSFDGPTVDDSSSSVTDERRSEK